jgi:hypothetical protein
MGDDFPNFSFIESDPCFMDLMAYPMTLKIIRVMIDDWLRLDHSYGIQMTTETETRENLAGHGTIRANININGTRAGCTTA